MRVKISLKCLLNSAINFIFWCCIFIFIFVTGQIFLFASFKIPSDSMQPGILTGDDVLVWKPSLGARLFNIFSALEDKRVNIYRLPGFQKIRRNDVLVFNFPYSKDGNRMEMQILQYYIKRCIALPNDTFYIDKGFYRVKNLPDTLGIFYSQTELSQMPDSTFRPEIYNCFPLDSTYRWTIKNFGPLYIPAKGSKVNIDTVNIFLYKTIIEYETLKAVKIRDDKVYLGDEVMFSYIFTKNYYFMAGDQVLNSQDSRYWGLLPEEFIVGKAAFIWKSKSPYTDKYRWKRFFNMIK